MTHGSVRDTTFMHTKIFLLALLTTSCHAVGGEPPAGSSAQPAGPVAVGAGIPGPRIAFDQTSFGFGRVESGELIKHTFWFTNIGSQRLEVREVRPSCGCTTMGEWDKQVEPGKFGSLPVQFNSAGYGGAAHKTVTVACNDSVNSNVVLQLTGTIWKAIEVTPPFASFSFGPDVQTNDTRVLRINNNLDEPLTLSEPRCGNQAFRPELKTVKEGKEYELRVTVVPPLTAPNVSSPITLKTSYSKMQVLNVNAFATVQPPVSALPMQLMLPAGPLTNTLRLAVTFQNNSTNDLRLSQPKANAEGVEATLGDIQPGRRVELAVTFPPGFHSQHGNPIEVTVESNFPGLPVLKIPVFQQAAPPAAASPPLQSARSSGAVDLAKVRHGPRVEFAATTFDFGRVESGTVVTRNFPFTNPGDELLEIRDVFSSCGCTAVENYSRRIEPGGSGTLPVLFNTSGMGGTVSKTLRVQSNAVDNSNIVIQIVAEVYKPIDAIPPVAAFNFGPDFQTNDTRVIRLVSNLAEAVAVANPVCTNRAFHAQLKTVKEGKEFEVIVTVVPPVAPGSTVAPITLKTSSPKMPIVTVMAYAMVQPALAVLPPRLRLPEVSLTEAAQFTVRIQNQSSVALVLSDPSVNAKGAELSLREVQPGRVFELHVGFPVGFRAEPGEEIAVHVKSSHSQFPIITVPVLQAVSGRGEDSMATAHELLPAQVASKQSGDRPQ
jgi:hypothetical protein